MSIFKLNANYKPSGDQPKAIDFLVHGIKDGYKDQVLHGVTGSGKTFAIANVIKNFDKPTLILSHNKTLASQLYSELKNFFPDNAVEYYISYFDYFRPEAYKPNTDTYIEKDSRTNEQIEIMRLSAINSLITRKDVIVVASVSAIYGALNPEIYKDAFYRFYKGLKIIKKDFIYKLIKILYTRNDVSTKVGEFSVKGDIIVIRPSDIEKIAVRVSFFEDEIEEIAVIDAISKNVIEKVNLFVLVPGDAYATDDSIYDKIIPKIKDELQNRLKELYAKNKLLEAQRLQQRVSSDIDELTEFKMCKGIENYSMYLDGRNFGERPYTLLDYFPKESLMFIDESHMSIPQLGGMYNGDRSRKLTLVEYGFRLPSALENRPLNFPEIESNFDFFKVYISATPAEYELKKSQKQITQMFIRPTGLTDPKIIIKSTENQMQDIHDIIIKQRENGEKTVVITVTKESSEKITEYLISLGVKAAYIHSEFETFQRNELIRKLRTGQVEVLIGVNLLREGIDIPEVSRVLILDADAQGFMRTASSLIQIVGRASRNANGLAVLYADKITPAIKECIEDNQLKRKLQLQYNQEHHIIPKTISKPIPPSLYGNKFSNAVDLIFKKKKHKSIQDLKDEQKIIDELIIQMEQASKERDYERAIEIRDMVFELQKELKNKTNK
ncbi:excinuclease ABC subunit B [Mycoplasmopsis mustelae]|uniref:UvrABC system protein B n=1 Tax=Mycoplasmopsis mustelae TaxID=171289 RepID=A0A4R7UD61_9BACT|nr:excinuclease ABC subunit UvrB [Mycoplasmopsis mustelae]TDV23305.1 excinuclease ABC subunit B [Mycoplasmopsis mustelae]